MRAVTPGDKKAPLSFRRYVGRLYLFRNILPMGAAPGKIRIQADFETHILKVEADYQFEEPIDGSLFLDTDEIDLKQATAKGKNLQWEFEGKDELLGKRLHLKKLENIWIQRCNKVTW